MPGRIYFSGTLRYKKSHSRFSNESPDRIKILHNILLNSKLNLNTAERGLGMYFLIVLLLCVSIGKSMTFDQYFIDKTMRIDYYHTGSATNEVCAVDRIYQVDRWAGNLNNCIDRFDNGAYYIKILDAMTGDLIFSKGFDSIFKEYKTTERGIKGINRTYHETALIPFPKKKIVFSLHMRKRDNSLEEVFREEIDPDSVDVIREEKQNPAVRVFHPVVNGDIHRKVDIVVLGEGYTGNEVQKFEKDLQRFVKVFFMPEPYTSNVKSFNISGVLLPSVESGVDEPRANIFKNTALNASFNSLGSERYLLTEDNKTMRDIAGNVPYDALFIMVNHARYGGGGIYNTFCTFTSDNQWYEYLLLHEFGHSFAGLADEYYTSETSYNDFYPAAIEPCEPNITALLDKDNVKWKSLLDKGIAVPTPWEKEAFDRMDLVWQKERKLLNNKIAQLKRERAQPEKIKQAQEEYEKVSRDHANKMDTYLESSKYFGKVGVFEGAGYASTGLYRPMIDCIMFSKGNKPFCKVCEKAIKKVIDYYCD